MSQYFTRPDTVGKKKFAALIKQQFITHCKGKNIKSAKL